jgi:hypothetical protein
MSIDTIARQACRGLTAATADLDVDDALRNTLDRTRRHRRLGPALVIVTAVMVLIVGWSLSGELRRSAVPAPPASTPSAAQVGGKLGAPLTAAAPAGWAVLKDGAYVEMRPSDGAPGVHIFMVVPRKVYDPPSYELAPLREDPAVWARTHPALTPSGEWGVDGPDFAWSGSTTDLSLSSKVKNDYVHLMPLSKAPGSPPLAITADDAMFRWYVIYFEDSDPLVIAAISPTPNDPNLTRSINDLLASIQIQQQ